LATRFFGASRYSIEAWQASPRVIGYLPSETVRLAQLKLGARFAPGLAWKRPGAEKIAEESG
jgi:hypothetical protein